MVWVSAEQAGRLVPSELLIDSVLVSVEVTTCSLRGQHERVPRPQCALTIRSDNSGIYSTSRRSIVFAALSVSPNIAVLVVMYVL